MRRRRFRLRRAGREEEAALLHAVGFLRGAHVARGDAEIAEVRDELLAPAWYLCYPVQVKVRRQRVEAPSRQDVTQHGGGVRFLEPRRAQGDAERFVVGDGPGFAGQCVPDGFHEHDVIADLCFRYDPAAAD